MVAGCSSSGSEHSHDEVPPSVQASTPAELAQTLAAEFQQVPEGDREGWIAERRLSIDQLGLSTDPQVKSIYDQTFAPYIHQ